MNWFRKSRDWSDRNKYRIFWRCAQIWVATSLLYMDRSVWVGWILIQIGIVMLPIMEKEKVERSGEGPTGFQYLWMLFFGRYILGFTKMPFVAWRSVLKTAARSFLPPFSRIVEKHPNGYCTWREYVHYHAGKGDVYGQGRNPAEYRKAFLKAGNM